MPVGFEQLEGGQVDARLFRLPTSQRWHWIYNHTNLPLTGPIEITRIDLRPDSGDPSWPAAIFPQLDLSLGRSRLLWLDPMYRADLDNAWDHGFPQRFFQGNLALPAGVATSSPQPWTLSFHGGFTLDPRDGRPLVLEWRAPVPVSPPWARLDAADTRIISGATIGNDASATAAQANVAEYTSVPIVRIEYRPAQAIHAAFRATPAAIPGVIQTGGSISFQDLSATPHPSGIASWAWDFDGNGIIDSNAQNPTFVYPRCGIYDVSLTVTDAAQASATVLRHGFTQVVPLLRLRADFVFQIQPATGRCPVTVAYTDRSVGSPTRWAWDFEADGIVDSTLQNPTLQRNATGPRRVRLQIWNSCETSTIERDVFDWCNPADQCQNAIPLTSGASFPGLHNFDATDSLQTSVCYLAHHDVWYRIAPCCTPVAVTVCPTSGPAGFRPQIQIYVGSCGALIPLACSESTCGALASALFFTYGQHEYFVRVSEPQGLEGVFTLSVQGFPLGGGSISRPFPGCGGATLQVQGAPRPGNNLTFQVASNGLPAAIWLGLDIEVISICPTPCFLVTRPHIFIAGPTTTFPIPAGSYVSNTRFFAQGAIVGAPGGCSFGAPFVTTDTVQIDVQ